MTPAQARKELRKLDQQALFRSDALCFPKQGAMVNAVLARERRNHAVLATRQSGKSHGGCRGSLLLAWNNPGTNQIYVASTHSTVTKMAFRPACEMVREYCLPATVNRSEHSITFSNGSCIYFLGADSEKAIGRLRGTPNLIACWIDEAGVYSSEMLKAMLEAVRPGLRPRAGSLIVMGTPSMDGPSGTWFEITEDTESYQQHRFSYLDNDKVPSFADVEKLIDEDLKAQKCTRESAYFLREYGAKFVVEISERLYKFDADRNTYDDLPDNLTHALICGDTGVKDADALALLMWADDDPTVYLVREHIRRGQDVDDLQAVLEAWIAEYAPFLIVLDAGANAKAVLTLQNRMPGVPITAAEKPPVNQQIAELNDFLVHALLKLPKTSQAAKEIRLPTWLNGIVNGKPQESGAKKSDVVPALRYGCIAVRPYLPEARQPELDDIKKARLAREARAARVAATQKAAKQSTKSTAEDLFDDDDGIPDSSLVDDDSVWG